LLLKYHETLHHFFQICTLYSCRVAEFERTCLVKSGIPTFLLQMFILLNNYNTKVMLYKHVTQFIPQKTNSNHSYKFYIRLRFKDTIFRQRVKPKPKWKQLSISLFKLLGVSRLEGSGNLGVFIVGVRFLFKLPKKRLHLRRTSHSNIQQS
jgi:hypothetical protein